MKIAVRIAQAGNQILNIIVMGIILFLFLYGGYSLWDTYMSAKSAFLSDDLLSYKPQPGEGKSFPGRFDGKLTKMWQDGLQ